MSQVRPKGEKVGEIAATAVVGVWGAMEQKTGVSVSTGQNAVSKLKFRLPRRYTGRRSITEFE
jgi:hypothetical protein